MWFMMIGVALLAMKLLELGPGAHLAWGWVLAPFLLALAWWKWCDMTGMSSRRAMERDAQRKEERRRRQVVSLGTGKRADRRSSDPS